jgi:hypothetical protein
MTPSQASRASDVAGAYVGLGSKHDILESVTPLGFDPEVVSEKREAERFEVFLCAYEKATDNISWLMYTSSAGERFKREPGIPLTSWAISSHSRTKIHLAEYLSPFLAKPFVVRDIGRLIFTFREIRMFRAQCLLEPGISVSQHPAAFFHIAQSML